MSSASAVVSSTCSGLDPARTGHEAHLGQDAELDPSIHLFLLNRGILMTPFHNMALMSPATTEADVDRHTAVFGAGADPRDPFGATS